jgi:cell division protein FtsL
MLVEVEIAKLSAKVDHQERKIEKLENEILSLKERLMILDTHVFDLQKS